MTTRDGLIRLARTTGKLAQAVIELGTITNARLDKLEAEVRDLKATAGKSKLR